MGGVLHYLTTFLAHICTMSSASKVELKKKKKLDRGALVSLQKKVKKTKKNDADEN